MPLREALIDMVIGSFGQTHILTLTNRLTGISIDLTGVLTAEMNVRFALTTGSLLTLSLDIQSPLNAGVLHLTWPEGATDDLDPGRYEGELVLTGADSVQIPYQLLQFQFRGVGVSAYLQTQIGNHLLRTGSWTKPTEIRVALFAGDPDGGGYELSGSGYARVLFGPTDALWSAVVNGMQTNLQDVIFPIPLANWGTADYAALFDASGNRLLSGPLAVPVACLAGSTQPTILAGDFTVVQA